MISTSQKSASAQPDTKLFITVTDAAKRLSCGVTLAYSLIAKGSFRTVKMGKKRLVDVASLESFAASLPNESGKGK